MPHSTGARNGRSLPGCAPASRSPRRSASSSSSSASPPASSTPSRRVCAARLRRFTPADLRSSRHSSGGFSGRDRSWRSFPRALARLSPETSDVWGPPAAPHRARKTEAAVGTVRLCFGSRTLFRRQFALAANGYASHDDWRREWRAVRSIQFFVIGSKDETAGCRAASPRSIRAARSRSGCAYRMSSPAMASTW